MPTACVEVPVNEIALDYESARPPRVLAGRVVSAIRQASRKGDAQENCEVLLAASRCLGLKRALEALALALELCPAGCLEMRDRILAERVWRTLEAGQLEEAARLARAALQQIVSPECAEEIGGALARALAG